MKTWKPSVVIVCVVAACSLTRWLLAPCRCGKDSSVRIIYPDRKVPADFDSLVKSNSYETIHHDNRLKPEATRRFKHDNDVKGASENNIDPIPNAEETNITAIIERIGKRKSFIVLLYLNLGFLNMTKSWICNVECMGVLEHTVIVCSDDKAYWSLKNWKPSLHVLLHRYGTTEAMTWGTDSYFDFLLYRAKSVESILRDNHSVFLVESDAVWLKNPTVLFNQYLNNDLILVANEHVEDESQRKALPALAYLNATSKTRRLWAKLVEICARKEDMYKRGISKNLGGSDMGTLNYLIRREPVKVQWLPDDKFVGGKWYGGAEYNEEIAKSIVVIHNNFIQGNDRKEERAKRWGHWFLSDDGTQCVGTPCSLIPNTWPQP